jgi:hypothetical protein
LKSQEIAEKLGLTEKKFAGLPYEQQGFAGKLEQ